DQCRSTNDKRTCRRELPPLLLWRRGPGRGGCSLAHRGGSWRASTIPESRVVAMDRPPGLPLPWGEGGVRGKERFDRVTMPAASRGSWRDRRLSAFHTADLSAAI